MGYLDKSMVPIRHIGHTQRLMHTGIGAYRTVTPTYAGTALTTPTEAEIETGTQTVTIELAGAEWLGAGAAFDASRQDIINGFYSDAGEASGFVAVVVPLLAVTDVARTSATKVTITLPAAPGYEITADERVKYRISPATVLGGLGTPSVAINFVVVNATPTVTAAITGTAIAGGVAESEIVTGGQTIIITLTGGTWVVTGGFNAVRQAILDGLVSAQSELLGWNNLRPTLPVTNVVRTSNSAVTITLSALGTYQITADETITVTVPRLAIATADSAVAGDVPVVVTSGA